MNTLPLEKHGKVYYTSNVKFLASSLLILTAVGFLPNEAYAKNWPTVGWFDIVELNDGCAATSEYSFDGRSDVKLALILGHDEPPVLMINSLDWSAENGRAYNGITYTLNNYVYSDITDDEGKVIASTKGNTFDGIYKGFIRAFPKQFLDDFSKGESLLIENGESTITHVNLHNSGAAVTKLRECAAYVKRQNDAKRAKEEQWDYIEKDPFAVANVKLEANQPPVPKNNPGSYATTNDYPSRALSEKREGVVGFSVLVAADGRVTSCEITTSSGHVDLDQATCANVKRRARFTPATDESALPTNGNWSSAVTWRIPSE